jgi:mono/diheme cytochrome c family protein
MRRRTLTRGGAVVRRRYIAAVVALLAFAPAVHPDDGADTFAGRCALCHGANGAGAVGPDIRCHRSIRDAVHTGRVAAKATMPPFPDLTDGEIDHVQQHLRQLCPHPDGRVLYAAQCARCHGASGDGTRQIPPVACATRLTDALARGRDAAMPAFPGVDETEAAAMQAYLDARCATRGRPVDLVYAANCATCHGRTGGGGRNAMWNEGPDLRCTAHDDFVEAVERGWGGMPVFPRLDHAAVEALYRRLHRTRCPATP